MKKIEKYDLHQEIDGKFEDSYCIPRYLKNQAALSETITNIIRKSLFKFSNASLSPPYCAVTSCRLIWTSERSFQLEMVVYASMEYTLPKFFLGEFLTKPYRLRKFANPDAKIQKEENNKAYDLIDRCIFEQNICVPGLMSGYEVPDEFFTYAQKHYRKSEILLDSCFDKDDLTIVFENREKFYICHPDNPIPEKAIITIPKKAIKKSVK